MGLIEKATRDIERITSNKGDFGVDISITSPGGLTVPLAGLHAKIHLGVDTDGNIVNSKKAHISISEKFLTDAGYPVRLTSGQHIGEVNLAGHKVQVKDSTEIVKTYNIYQWFPDETIGLIVCFLQDAKN